MTKATILRGTERLTRLEAARQWRRDNKPYFDAIYGPETKVAKCGSCDGTGRIVIELPAA